MGVLTITAAAVAAAYLVPRLGWFTWSVGTTWLGKTALTWAAVAVGWDMVFNTGDEAFDGLDLVASGGLTLAIRAVV